MQRKGADDKDPTKAPPRADTPEDSAATVGGSREPIGALDFEHPSKKYHQGVLLLFCRRTRSEPDLQHNPPTHAPKVAQAPGDDAISRTLIQAIYRSRCLTDAAGELAILEASRRNNPTHNITGVLVSHGGWFMQVLEGPVLAVNNLMAKIRTDSRNCDFLLLRANSIGKRDFGEWSMASTQVDADQFMALLDGLMYGTGSAIHMLQDFIVDGRWRGTPGS